MGSLQRPEGPPELQIRNHLNDISLAPLNQNHNNFTELFLIIHSTKIAQNGYAPLNNMTARVPDKKYLSESFPLEPLVQIQNKFTGLFLMMPSSNIAQMVPVILTKGLP